MLLGVDEIGAGAGAMVTVDGAVFVAVLIGATGNAVVASAGATLGVMQLGGSTAFCGFANVNAHLFQANRPDIRRHSDDRHRSNMERPSRTAAHAPGAS